MFPSAASTSSAVTGLGACSTSTPLYSPRSIEGLTSTTATKLNGAPSSSLTSWRSGSLTGSSFASESACRYTSGIRCSATSRRTSSEKCTFTSERGTWPFRNPGRRAIFCTRPYARSHSFCTTSTGASMARRRLQPSIGSTATFIDTPVWCEGEASIPDAFWTLWIPPRWYECDRVLQAVPSAYPAGIHEQTHYTGNSSLTPGDGLGESPELRRGLSSAY